MVMDHRDIKIIINNCNRVTCLKALLEWLEKADQWNITIIDNVSSYAPLLRFYKTLKKNIDIRMLPTNQGPYALWADYNEDLRIPPFVYTDSDIVPTEECPTDAIGFFLQAANAFATTHHKVGFGLKIDDLPDSYSQKDRVITWEKRFWQQRAGHEDGPIFYHAAIDTGFALYTRPVFDINAIRTGEPYIARHLPWYIDSKNPTEEEQYYEDHARGLLGWKINSCSPYVEGYCKERGV